MAHTCHRMFKHLKSQILCGRVLAELFSPSMQQIFLEILYNVLRIFWDPKCVSEKRDKKINANCAVLGSILEISCVTVCPVTFSFLLKVGQDV